jgi:hypothetical protein
MLTWKKVVIILLLVLLISVASHCFGDAEQRRRETWWATVPLTPEDLKQTVFLGIAVEPGGEIEAAHTIFSALNNATRPHVIRVGVLQYTKGKTNNSMLDAYFGSFRAQYERVCSSKGAKSFSANIRVHLSDRKHRGNSVSRHTLLKHIFDQEKYVCFTQPGICFCEKWDAVALLSLEQAQSIDGRSLPRAILTAEAGEADTVGRPTYPRVVMSRRGGIGPRWPSAVAQVFDKPPSRPYEAALWSDAWSFSPANAFVRDAVPDNTMSRCDEADQLVTTTLLLSHGWGIYSPVGAVVYMNKIMPNSDPRPLLHPSRKQTDLYKPLVLLNHDPCKACGQPHGDHPDNHDFEASHGGRTPNVHLGSYMTLDVLKARFKKCWIDAHKAGGLASMGIVSMPTPPDETLAKGGLI